MEFLRAGSENLWIYLIVMIFWIISSVLEAKKKQKKKAEQAARNAEEPENSSSSQSTQDSEALRQAEEEVREAPYQRIPTGRDQEVDFKELMREYLGLPPEEPRESSEHQMGRREHEVSSSEHEEVASERSQNPLEISESSAETSLSSKEHVLDAYSLDQEPGDQVRGLLGGMKEEGLSDEDQIEGVSSFDLRSAVLASEILGKPKSVCQKWFRIE